MIQFLKLFLFDDVAIDGYNFFRFLYEILFRPVIHYRESEE